MLKPSQQKVLLTAKKICNRCARVRKDEEDDDYEPNNDDYIPLSTFKIRRKTVLKSLRKLDPHKSMNGFGNRFPKECAEEIVDSATTLFKFIVRKHYFVSKWKI